MAKQLKLEVLLKAIDQITGPIKSATKSSDTMARAIKTSRDELKQLGAAQKDLSAYKDLAAQSRNAAKALGDQQVKVKQLSAQIAAAGTPTKALNAEFKKAVTDSKRLETQHNNNQAKLRTLTDRLKTAGVSTSHLAKEEFNLRSRAQGVNRELEQQQALLKRTADQQRKLASAKASYDKTKSVAGGMAATGAKTAAVGGAVLYGGARFLEDAVGFDKTMAKVQALGRLDKNSDAYKSLRAQARELGATTQFSGSDAAAGQAFLAMAGFTPDAIKKSMPGLLNVALAGDMDLARTADISSNILSGLGLDPKEMTRVSDVIVGTFSRSNTSIETIGDTMKYVAPVAKNYGQSLEIAAALSGKLGDAGIQGGQAGTSLRKIFSRLASPPKVAAEAIDKLGIKTKDAAGNMRDLPSILEDINKATAKMGNTERGGLMKALAGEEASTALMILAEQAGTGELQKLIADLKNAQGEAAKTALVMGDNLAGDIKAMGSAWEEVKHQIFDGQDGALRETIQSVTGLITKTTDWIAANPELTATIIKVVAAVAALMVIVGTLLTAVAGILVPLAGIKYAMTVLGIKALGLSPILAGLKFAFLGLGKAMLLNPIGLIVVGLVALGAAVWWAWNNIEPFREFMLSAWGVIVEYWQSAVGGLTNLMEGFGAAWGEGWKSTLMYVLGLLAEFSPLSFIYKGFAAVMGYLGIDLPATFKEAGAALIDGLISGITERYAKIKGAIKGAADSVKNWFKDSLGINSPSKVFAEYGINTLQGYEEGIDKSEGGTLKRMGEFAKGTAAIGAGIIASGSAIAFDTQAPISTASYSHAMPSAGGGGDTYNFYITGEDPRAIASQIETILRQRDSEKERQQRSLLSDRYSL